MTPEQPSIPHSSLSSKSKPVRASVDPFRAGALAALRELENLQYNPAAPTSGRQWALDRVREQFGAAGDQLDYVNLTSQERRREKLRSKKEAILRSAARAFSRKGYHGTSMDDIAAELLMTKGALYYYFKDKEDILFACHDNSLNQALENLEVVRAMEAGPADKLHALIRAHTAVLLDTLQGSAMALDFNALAPELFSHIVGKRDMFERGMRSIIDEAVAAGEFKPCDSKLTAFMILGSLNWLTKWFQEGAGPYTAESLADAYADFFVNNLRSGNAKAAKPAAQAAAPAKPAAKAAMKPIRKPVAKGAKSPARKRS